MAINADAHRRAVENQILTKAIKDDSFRQSLVSDPRGTLEQEFGVSLPATANVQVLQETDTDYYIVLPPKSATGADAPKPVSNVALGSGWVTTCSGSTSGCDSTCSTCSSCSINCTC